MRRGKRPAAGGTGPGLPGPVAWVVGMPATQPPRKPLSLSTHLAWDLLPGAAPEVVRAGGWRGKVLVWCARMAAVCPMRGNWVHKTGT